MDKLIIKLSVCTEMIEKSGVCRTVNISGLNKFCAAVHKFASEFKIYLLKLTPKYDLQGNKQIQIETIYLCFTQVLTCITQLERTMTVESSLENGTQILLSRINFLDRINWCLHRFHASLYQLSKELAVGTEVKLEDLSYVELLDIALDKLEVFNEIVNKSSEFVAKDTTFPTEQTHDVQQLSTEVNHIVRHALAFANVALETDKKALNAICETVLEESSVFETNFEKNNAGERKLEALSLQRSLYCLETYLNEALLRLVFTSFHDVEDNYLSMLKNTLQKSTSSTDADKLIADFYIHMDRLQQIGVFAIAFTENVKTKTIVRSCLASLESLNTCIVPAFQLQTSLPGVHHANILECHFKEELVIFRNVIHEIIDSGALISSFLDMLTESINSAEKFDPMGQLLKVVQMGNLLYQHFLQNINYGELNEDGRRCHLDFAIILGECQAILKISEQVESRRIIKRLKILYSVLTKLYAAFRKHVKQESVFSRDSVTKLNITKNLSAAHHSKIEHTISKCTQALQEKSLCKEGNLISFQLTQILKLE